MSRFSLPPQLLIQFILAIWYAIAVRGETGQPAVIRSEDYPNLQMALDAIPESGTADPDVGSAPTACARNQLVATITSTVTTSYSAIHSIKSFSTNTILIFPR